jgi:hypothetical protein
MSKSSVRKAGRAAKSARASVKVKKSAKLVRTASKKTAKPTRAPRTSAQSSAARARAVKAIERMIHTASPPVQPSAAPAIVLRSHKYDVGEIVYYTSPSFGRAAATGSYKVVKQLPSEGDDYQYRIKSSDEAFERVAKESQLDRA